MALFRWGRADLEAARRLVADEERLALERAEELCRQAERLLDDVRRYKETVRIADFRPLRDELERAIHLAQKVEAGLSCVSGGRPLVVDLRLHGHTGNGRDAAGAAAVQVDEGTPGETSHSDAGAREVEAAGIRAER